MIRRLVMIKSLGEKRERNVKILRSQDWGTSSQVLLL